MRKKHIKTYFHGEGALAKKKKVLSKEEWQKLSEKFPDGIPRKRRFSDGAPQRSLHVYYIRRSTSDGQVSTSQ